MVPGEGVVSYVRGTPIPLYPFTERAPVCPVADYDDMSKPQDEVLKIRHSLCKADIKQWAKWCEAEACKTYTPDLRRKKP